MTSVVLGHIPFAIIGILFFGLPNIDGLKFILASSLLHFFYQVFLLNAYRYGELSEIYPIARGLSPLIILIVSFLFFHEEISKQEIFAIFLISFSLIIYGLKQFLLKNLRLKALFWLLLQGFLLLAILL